jgi:hypothetical protein
LGVFTVLSVLTVFVAVGLAETVVMLLGAALAVTGDGEFCVFVEIVLVLALGDVLP